MQWHAYADRAILSPGTALLVTGGTEMVQIAPGGRISIDLSTEQRVEALVLDRDGDMLNLQIPGSAPITLQRAADTAAFTGFKLSDGFSRELWIVQ